MFAKSVTIKPRRFLMALGTLGLVAAVWAPAPVGAQQSPPIPVEGTVTYDPGVTCSFGVQLDFQGKGGTIQLPNGTLIFTSPDLTVTVTNFANPMKQVDLKVPGPVMVLASGEAVFVGPSLVARSTVFGDDTNALVYVAERFTFLSTREPPFSGVGMLVDVCALLA
jgi:hypothetical protein